MRGAAAADVAAADVAAADGAYSILNYCCSCLMFCSLLLLQHLTMTQCSVECLLLFADMAQCLHPTPTPTLYQVANTASEH